MDRPIATSDIIVASIPKEEILTILEEEASEFLATQSPGEEFADVVRQQLPDAVSKALPIGIERQALEDDILEERARQEEIFKRVQRIQINASRAVNDVLAGEYVSVFKGRGMEFEEVREYQPGDEVRTIDWNVTARMGHPYVKRFVEERELSVMLLVDASSSGDFGTAGKLKNDVAAEICAVLAFSAIKNNDKVGLIIFSDTIEKFVPPKKGKAHVLRVIRELLVLGARRPMSAVRRRQLTRVVRNIQHWPPDFSSRRLMRKALKRLSQPSGERVETDIGGALEYLSKITKTRAAVFLVSDFIASGYESQLRIANKRFDIIAITIQDPREISLPSIGMIELQDAETGEVILVDTRDTNVLQGFEVLNARENGERKKLFQSMSVDEIAVRTDESLLDPIQRFFRMRERRL